MSLSSSSISSLAWYQLATVILTQHNCVAATTYPNNLPWHLRGRALSWWLGRAMASTHDTPATGCYSYSGAIVLPSAGRKTQTPQGRTP